MKYVRFQQSYKVPDESNIEDATEKFEDGILYIIIPNKSPQLQLQHHHHPDQQQNQQDDLDKDEVVPNQAEICDNQRPEEEEGVEEDGFVDAKVAVNEGNEIYGRLRMQLMKNKGIVATAILAFSLGVFVSHKFQTPNDS